MRRAVWCPEERAPGSVYRMPNRAGEERGHTLFIVERCAQCETLGWTLHLRPLDEAEKIAVMVLEE